MKVALATGHATIDGRVVAAGATVSLEPGSHQVEVQSGDDRAGPAYVDIPTRPCEIRIRPELACYEAK